MAPRPERWWLIWLFWGVCILGVLNAVCCGGCMLEISHDGFTVKMVDDSLAPSGVRLSTIAATYHRFIHSEVLTHRDLSRNSASSRAIPAAKLAERIQNDPAIPVWWGKNRSGMQAFEEVEDKAGALRWWLRGRDLMLAHHAEGIALGIHKQIVNRVIEPWMKITVVMTASRFNNLLFQRVHKAAQPEFQKLACLVKALRAGSEPKRLELGEWHTPYVRDEDLLEFGVPFGTAAEGELSLLPRLFRHPILRISVGRCARVSYFNHEGIRAPKEDVELADKLEHELEPEEPGHWSPFEHVAMAMDDREFRSGNLNGWLQYRKLFPREYRGEP